MKNRKFWISVMAGLMAAIMLLSLVLSLIPTNVSAAESASEIKSQINDLVDQQEELRAQMEELQSQQKENLTEIQDIVAQKNNIDQQIGLLHAEVQNINTQITAYGVLIADKQDELDAAEARLAELNEQNRERIRTMEAEGSLSYWSVLFKANSFSDLLDRLNMIQEIAAADQRRLEEMSQVAERVARAQEELTAEKTSLEDSRAELDAAQAMLDGKRAEADALITELLSKGEELNALMLDFEQQEQDLLAEIGAKEHEYNEARRREYEQWLSTSVPDEGDEEDNNSGSSNSGGSTGSSGGGSSSGWLVPCSYICVTSAYGYREPPTAGASSFHAGVDLAGNTGTPIYASRSGTVTTATYGWSGGYYVTINHGDGYSSSYLHMTHYVVSAGDYVSQGQVIGYMGSTGVSTGPHLHFSIYKDGKSKNPADYIPI